VVQLTRKTGVGVMFGNKYWTHGNLTQYQIRTWREIGEWTGLHNRQKHKQKMALPSDNRTVFILWYPRN